MKIATYNINSVRIRLPDLLEFMRKDDIDIIALQETKAQDKDYPINDIIESGFHTVFKGQKSRNGVAFIAKKPFESVSYEKNNAADPDEARIITVKYDGINIINTYVPQGGDVDTPYFEYKLNWIKAMREFINPQNTIWLGDLNVAPTAIDVYDATKLDGSLGYHPKEREALEFVTEIGLFDFFRKCVTEKEHYTFWDYRVKNAFKRKVGWRIDHILGTKDLYDKVTNAYIATYMREQERPSDHAPLVVELKT